VVGARVDVGARSARVVTRIAAGEDARAKVCVRPRAAVGSAMRVRCRAVTVRGLRPVNLAVEISVPEAKRVEVAVEIAAEANRSRKTRVVKEAALGR
jgi:hypothetical protein